VPRPAQDSGFLFNGLLELNLMRQDLAAQDNDTLALLAWQAPRRLFPLATAWPQLGEAAVTEVVR
jgi:hypothetical protein